MAAYWRLLSSTAVAQHKYRHSGHVLGVMPEGWGDHERSGLLQQLLVLVAHDSWEGQYIEHTHAVCLLL